MTTAMPDCNCGHSHECHDGKGFCLGCNCAKYDFVKYQTLRFAAILAQRIISMQYKGSCIEVYELVDKLAKEIQKDGVEEFVRKTFLDNIIEHSNGG